MSTKDEEDAWRSIVENYGERARLDDDVDAYDDAPGDAPGDAQGDAQGHPQAEPQADGPTPDGPAPRATPLAQPPGPGRFVPFEGVVDLPGPGQPRRPDDREDEEARFVPETPPLPHVPPRRLAAWCVLVLAPLVLILCGAMQWYVPTPVKALLVAAPLGAFAYLLATMSREPRDPYDDGARV